MSGFNRGQMTPSQAFDQNGRLGGGGGWGDLICSSGIFNHLTTQRVSL